MKSGQIVQPAGELSTEDFLVRFSWGKDIIFTIFAFASPRLHRRLHATSSKNRNVSAVILFKFCIYAVGRLTELSREFPTAFEWPETAILINPTFDPRANINRHIISRGTDVVSRIKDSANGRDNRTLMEMVALVQDAFRQQDPTFEQSLFNTLDFSQLPAPFRTHYFSLFDTAANTSKQQLLRLAATNRTEEILALKPGKLQVWRNWSAELKTARYGDGFTPLHIAAASGNDATVRLFIAEGAPVDSLCEAGLTPLYYAIKCGHKSAAQQLIVAMLDRGIDLNANSHQFGVTPFFIAFEFGRQDYFDVEGVDHSKLCRTFRLAGYADNERRMRKEEYKHDNFFSNYTEDNDVLIAATVMGAMNTFKELYDGKLVSYSCAQRQIKTCDLLSLAAGFNQREIAHFILNNHAEMLSPYFSWKSRFYNQMLGTDYDTYPFAHQLSRSAEIAVYIMYTLALYGTRDDATVQFVARYLQESNEYWVKEIGEELRNDILEGNFVPYQHITDPEIKAKMIENTEIFLETLQPLQRLKSH